MQGVAERQTAGGMAHTLDHRPHVEMENIVRGVVSSLPAWLIFQVVFLGSCVLMAISCIVVTATSFDALSVLLCGNSWGLQLTPRVAFVASCPEGAWQCAGAGAFAGVEAEAGTLISLGYVLTVAITAPLALVEVSEPFQFASYALSLACLLFLIAKFSLIAAQGAHLAVSGLATGGSHLVDGVDDQRQLPPVWKWDPGLALEVSFYSWTISFAVPMWLDELSPEVHMEGSLLASFAHRALLDLALGLSGAAAFPHMPPNGLNVLQTVGVHPQCGLLTQMAGIVFVISSLATSIVDYAMVAVRNLEAHTGDKVASLAGVALPFMTGWLFYFGKSFANLLNIAAPLLNGSIQFMVPGALFYAYSRLDRATPSYAVLGVDVPAVAIRALALSMVFGTAVLIAATYALPTLAETPKADYAADYTAGR